MRAFFNPIRTFFQKKRVSAKKGQTLVEYALVLAILTLLAVGVFSALGQRVIQIFSGIDAILDTAQGS